MRSEPFEWGPICNAGVRKGTVVHVYDYKGAVVFGNISINFPERFVDVAFIC